MIKILDIENIKFESINQKFGLNKKAGRLFVKKEYKDFKNMVARFSKGKLENPYKIYIFISSYLDWDNCIKAICDGLENAGVIENDKDIYSGNVEKYPLKKTELGRLVIFGETLTDRLSFEKRLKELEGKCE